MNVAYLFCEANTVRIPFLDYDKNIYNQLIKIGGIWDAVYGGFIFKQKIYLKQIKTFFDIVCVISNITSQIKIYGFSECSKEENTLHQINSSEQFSSSHKEENLPEKLQEHLIYKLESEMRSRKFSLKTQNVYIYFNRLLCRTLRKYPEEISPDDVTEFLETR